MSLVAARLYIRNYIMKNIKVKVCNGVLFVATYSPPIFVLSNPIGNKHNAKLQRADPGTKVTG